MLDGQYLIVTLYQTQRDDYHKKLHATIETTEVKVQIVGVGQMCNIKTNTKMIPVERLQPPQNIIECICEYVMNIGFYNSHQIYQ